MGRKEGRKKAEEVEGRDWRERREEGKTVIRLGNSN